MRFMFSLSDLLFNTMTFSAEMIALTASVTRMMVESRIEMVADPQGELALCLADRLAELGRKRVTSRG